jgi:two-component system sensor histidine kinase CpxA
MTKFNAFIHKINPRNTLFGRILVWFWATVVVMVALAFFVARFMNQSWQVSAMPEDQYQRGNEIQSNLQRQLDRNTPLNRALRRLSARGRWNMMAINMQTNELTLGFPAPLMTQPAKFIALKSSPTPLVIKTNQVEFYGPFIITTSGQEHALFVGRLLRRDEQPKFALSWAFLVSLGVGIAACIGIAYTITKPIRQLSELSKDFAAGDIHKANKDLSLRKDEIGQLHNDIFDMASNLAKSLSQQKALMANVSHELRTPLTRLSLATSMLNLQNDEQQRYGERIEKDINIMDKLIGQALQLARMNDESQAHWLKCKPCSLKHVLEPLIADLHFEAKAINKDININDFDDINIDLIESSFVSAVENVVRNAIKYANSVVKIRVMKSLCAIEQKSDSVDKYDNVEALTIVVEDDGQGLSEHDIAHILEPFYRAQSNQEENGVGLGLSIVKAALELHHGSIDISASELGGLCLRLVFPIAQSCTLQKITDNK